MVKENIVVLSLIANQRNEVSNILASELEMYFLDVNKLIAFDISPVAVPEYIKEYGIEYYRKTQYHTCKYTSFFKNTVISPDINIVLNEHILINFKKTSLIVFLNNKKSDVKNFFKNEKYVLPEEEEAFRVNDNNINSFNKAAQNFADIIIDCEKKSAFSICSDIIRELKKMYEVK